MLTNVVKILLKRFKAANEIDQQFTVPVQTQPVHEKLLNTLPPGFRDMYIKANKFVADHWVLSEDQNPWSEDKVWDGPDGGHLPKYALLQWAESQAIKLLELD